LNRWAFGLHLWTKLPLAAFAGLRLAGLDEQVCTVILPSGWRTQNPFGSTYFAAQAMAAELSTGAPALMLVAGVPGSVSMLVREIKAVFVKKVVGHSFWVCRDVMLMREAVERAARSGESETFVARSAGHDADATAVGQFEITWSFKRRD
jgi:hypothetical protein